MNIKTGLQSEFFAFSREIYAKFFFRTTTLNDIYRNMGLNQVRNDERNLKNRQDTFADDDLEGFEEGDVTGFMEHKFLPSSGTNSFNVSFLCFELFLSCGSSLDHKNKAECKNR